MRARSHSFAVCFFLLAMANTLCAHEVRPGYLELRQIDANAYAVLWKVPAVGDMRLSIQPRFPKNCKTVGDVTSYRSTDSYTERLLMACPGGLNERTLAIDGLAATMTDVLARIERTDGSTQVARLTQSKPNLIVEASPGRLQVARVYSVFGGRTHFDRRRPSAVCAGPNHNHSWRLETGEDRHGIYRFSQHYADCGNTRLCARLAKARRSNHCAEYRVRCLRDLAWTTRKAGNNRPGPVDRGANLRPFARSRFCRRSQRCRSSSGPCSAGASFF